MILNCHDFNLPTAAYNGGWQLFTELRKDFPDGVGVFL